MRSAIYARYSSDLQSAASIEDQVRLCRERATRDGHEVVEVYGDYAISGGHLASRPGMVSLLEGARAGEFDVVYAEALDRLSRDQEDIAAIFKRLGHAGVHIVTLSEGEINELHVGLKGTMNALYLKDLAQKTRRGQRGCVEAGRIPGGKSYGYRMVRRLTDTGVVTAGEREIDAAEAAVVRRTFKEYAAGWAPRRIAGRLNAEGIASPRGGLWNASTINGSRQRRNGILNNELYIGRITYNRQRFVKDPETGKRVSRPNPDALWVTTDVPHLRIVDAETWEVVQALKGRYSSHQGNRRQTRKRLLSGLLRCGACGGAMTIVNRERYYCAAKRERGSCTQPVGIQAAEVEARVLDGLKAILVGREDLIAEFATAYRVELEQLRRTRGRRNRQLQKELAKTEHAIARCLAYITGGDGDPGSVRDTLRDLEARKKSLEQQSGAETDVPTIEIHPNVAEHYRRKVSELQCLLADEAARAEAMEAVRSLIDRIEVRAGAKRGEAEVILVGALARILDFACAERKTAASRRGGGCRNLLVAGAGFEPATFRL